MILITHINFKFSNILSDLFLNKHDCFSKSNYHFLDTILNPHFQLLRRISHRLKSEIRYSNYNVDVFCHHYRIW